MWMISMNDLLNRIFKTKSIAEMYYFNTIEKKSQQHNSRWIVSNNFSLKQG